MRAVLMFDGPPRHKRYCEGCPLYEATRENDDCCPIWGQCYRESSGYYAGLLCRADDCRDNENAVADDSKRDSVFRALQAGTP